MIQDEYGFFYSDDNKQLLGYPDSFSGNYSITPGTESISSKAFMGSNKITRLTIPASVKTIMKDAFKNVTRLTTLSFEGSLLQWMQIKHDGDLRYPHRLLINNSEIKDIEIPHEIKVISNNVFHYCQSIKNVKFHTGISVIEDNAFLCSTLSGKIILPEGLDTIGNSSFYGCGNITHVSIPSSVSKIGDSVFLHCFKLGRIDVDENNSVYSSINGVLFNKDKTSLIFFPPQHEDFDIPMDTVHLCLHAFNGAESAKTISIANPNLFAVNAKVAFEDATISTIYIPVGSKTYFIRQGFPEAKLVEKFSVSASISDDGVKGLIRENPFRTIGVASNASAKEISSSTNKIKRYLEVGKSIESGLDLVNLLGPIERSPEVMDKAYSSISMPQDKIKAALFWFFKRDDPIDEIAFNQIQAGNYEKVLDLYKNVNTPASLINRGVLYFVQKNYQEGLSNIGKVLCIDDVREQFVKSVCGESVVFSEEELSKIFVDELSTKVRLGDLRVLFDEASPSPIADSYLQEKTRNDSLGHIESLMRVARETKDDDYDGLKKIGLELAASLADLETIKSIYGANSAQFEAISDNLSVAIVDTGVRLAKLTDVSDREALNMITMQMLIKVLRVPFSEKVKTYCQEQYDAITHVGFRAPQKAYKEEDAIIRAKVKEIRDYEGESISKLVDMVSECLPPLASAKKKGGDYYLTVTSEDVANLALTKSIPIVNKYRKDDTVVSKAIQLIKYLLAMPVSDSFRKDRLLSNYSTLIQNPPKGVDLDLIKIKYTVIDDQQELDIWNNCNTDEQYNNYLSLYPKGKYVPAAQNILRQHKAKRKRIITWTSIISVVILFFVIIGIIYGIETIWAILGFIGIGFIQWMVAPRRRR